MRLAIFGPTGGTGRRLVERAIAEGHDVTALARNPSRVTAPRAATYRGGGRYLCSLGAGGGSRQRGRDLRPGLSDPSNPLHPRRPGHPHGVYSAGAENIVAVMKEHGLRRFVCQTAWGWGRAGKNPGFAGAFFMNVLVPPLLRDEYADKESQEKIVADSDLDWIIVRPMIMTNGPWTND